MTEADRSDAPRANGPHCPSCFLPLGERAVFALFDANTDRNVRLFQCKNCRKHVWDDEAA